MLETDYNLSFIVDYLNLISSPLLGCLFFPRLD